MSLQRRRPHTDQRERPASSQTFEGIPRPSKTDEGIPRPSRRENRNVFRNSQPVVLQCVHLDRVGHYQNSRNELTQKRQNKQTDTNRGQSGSPGRGSLGGLGDPGPSPQILCPEFVIPKDHQGAESDVKAKEPLFELARAQSPTCTVEVVRYRGERVSKGQRFY